VGLTGSQGTQGFTGTYGPFGANSNVGGAPGATIPGPQGNQGPSSFQNGFQGATGPVGPPAPSDRRLKKDIKKIEGALNKVLKLRGVYFNWKNFDYQVENRETERELGFIAQEIEHVIPELVFKKNTENAKFQVKYPDMIALCLEAIKEQSEILDNSEKKLSTLENIAKEKGLI
jgi:hypothetical protein